MTEKEFLKKIPEHFILTAEAAGAILDALDVSFMSFCADDQEFNKHLAKLYKECNVPYQDGYALMDSGIVFCGLPSTDRPLIWIRAKFNKYVPAGTLFHSIGSVLDYRSAEENEDDPFIQSYADYLKNLHLQFGEDLASDFFDASAWGRGVLAAIHADANHESKYTIACMSQIDFEAKQENSPCKTKLKEILNAEMFTLIDLVKSKEMSFVDFSDMYGEIFGHRLLDLADDLSEDDPAMYEALLDHLRESGVNLSDLA